MLESIRITVLYKNIYTGLPQDFLNLVKNFIDARRLSPPHARVYKNNTPRPDPIILSRHLRLIPRGVVGRITRETGIDAKACSFSVLRQLSAMMFA